MQNLFKTSSAGNNDAIFSDKQRAIKTYQLMQWAKWATFGLYIVAVFMLYVSDVWGIGTFIEQKSNDWVALIVFSVIAFILAFFLASSKEAVYEDIAIHRSEGYKLKPAQILALILFLSSGLLFELFSTSNNQQHITNAAAESSSMMKEVTGSSVALSTGSTALTRDLQAAQMRLADCQVRMEKALASGKKFDCAQSEANLAAVRESMAISNQLAQQTNAAALNAKTDAMLKVREHYDKPMFKEIGKVAGGDNNTGMMIVIGVLIFIFECQHIMALFAYANALRRIKGKGGNIASDKPRSTQDAYNVSPALSAFDSAKMTVSEYAAKVEAGLKASPEVIANEYGRAQYARDQMAETMGNAAKTVGDKLDSMAGKPDQKFLNEMLSTIKFQLLRSELEPTAESLYPAVYKTLYDAGYETPRKTVMKLAAHLLEHLAMKDNVLVKRGNEYQLSPRWHSDAPEIKEATGFKQSPDQAANVSKLYQDGLNDHAAGKVFNNESPTPPIKSLSVSETINALLDSVKKSGAKTEADIRAAVFDGYSKLFNPADLDDGDLLKVAAKIAKTMPAQSSAMPTPSTMPVQRSDYARIAEQGGIGAQSETMPAQSEVVELTGTAKQIEADLYPEWLEQVKTGEITPAAQHCKQFISKRTKNKDAAIGITAPEMGRIWLSWQDRASNDGVLTANPKYQAGNRQPKYLKAA
ncbi:MAG: hypothetical protein BWK73_05825 [Thiothrix lacustris]|uniref:Uncharacterized protein n=1 Tax=Thiothrix lacustris TaxID=525917 RepID=A0A1Y1QXJ4_9GAMM|nr:MAG: hypothetical protein BWK73_05825 [Thiothrix lacustris]